ncbi:MAG: class I tRNA ligase family protein, partial [bacterium]|nr:class I tRNA ligase family protein [bacterium]
LPVIELIDEEANYISDLGEFSGKNAKKHPELIIDFLKTYQDGKYFFASEKYTHRYPACWRCKTELVWRVVDEWYIAIDPVREGMKKIAKEIDWLPKFGLMRELDWLSNMHDWLISKKRYWGLALPIWECDKCHHFEVIGSKEELKEKSVAGWGEFEGQTPHRPYIDEVELKCEKCEGMMRRIPDVGNPWLDAGIVPFSTMPKDWFPADFITESFPGQFKNWFYSLIAMSTIMENKIPTKTILGFATLLAEDGRAMHKSLGNSIEFNEGADKIGVDVMRWMYITQNPAENLLFGYHKADEIRRKFHLILWNVYNFFITYATIDKWDGKKEVISGKTEADHILDQWILSKLNGLIREVTASLEKYDAQTAGLKIENFVSDLSLWYVRRSRDRVGPSAKDEEDRISCYLTLWEVLTSLCQILAPFTPFLAEEMFKNLTREESVHLSDWPKVGVIDAVLEGDMILVRKICELGHAARKDKQIKVRQPLSKIKVKNVNLKNKYLEQLILEELNIKEMEWVLGKGELEVELDTTISVALKEEGEARELIRQIQELRKEAGCSLDEKVTIYAPSWPKEFEEYIKGETLAKEILEGHELKIEK